MTKEQIDAMIRDAEEADECFAVGGHMALAGNVRELVAEIERLKTQSNDRAKALAAWAWDTMREARKNEWDTREMGIRDTCDSFIQQIAQLFPEATTET